MGSTLGEILPLAVVRKRVALVEILHCQASLIKAK